MFHSTNTLIIKLTEQGFGLYFVFSNETRCLETIIQALIINWSGNSDKITTNNQSLMRRYTLALKRVDKVASAQ